ncbi:MAG: hypothetical protein MUO26_11610 [Methanotrichaceae archaeon]|nr:hypothetical protein [Methanotrichaceae archaeon]
MSLLPIVQSFLIILILSALNFYWDRNNLNRERVIEIVLFWCIVYGIGVAGLTAFIGHTYLADIANSSISGTDLISKYCDFPSSI